MYVCRCGDELEVGQVTAELTLQADNGSETAYLCGTCTAQAWAFLRNQTAHAVVIIMATDDEDYDDLSEPIEITEDWSRDVRTAIA